MPIRRRLLILPRRCREEKPDRPTSKPSRRSHTSTYARKDQKFSQGKIQPQLQQQLQQAVLQRLRQPEPRIFTIHQPIPIQSIEPSATISHPDHKLRRDGSLRWLQPKQVPQPSSNCHANPNSGSAVQRLATSSDVCCPNSSNASPTNVSATDAAKQWKCFSTTRQLKLRPRSVQE